MMYFGNRPMGGPGGRFISFGWELLICLSVLVLVVLGIIALIRYIRITSHAHKIEMPPTNTAMTILNERYARGEITEEEYRVKKAEFLR
jgi:putative membrane protein